jgi:hypothetical protein
MFGEPARAVKHPHIPNIPPISLLPVVARQ